jgi:CheY-like chemotaxis protein
MAWYFVVVFISMGNFSVVNNQYILLAEDDPDDCDLFEQALGEVNIYLKLVTVNNGVALMNYLKEAVTYPQIVFLDLNIPLLNGLECLQLMKESEKLKNIPVIIYSNSDSPKDIEKARKGKAHYYITKSGSFSGLKKIIQKVLVTDFVNHLIEPPKEKFILFAE